MAPDDGTSGVAAQEREKRLRACRVGSPLQQYRLLVDRLVQGNRYRPAAGRRGQRRRLQLRRSDKAELRIPRCRKLQRLRNILTNDEAALQRFPTPRPLQKRFRGRAVGRRLRIRDRDAAEVAGPPRPPVRPR